MKQVNQVYQTNDYSVFKHIDGNRAVNKIHLKRLMRSIDEKYISVPIIVNSRYEIIDGQHRFESAKQLHKPIYFIRINGLELPDIHRLNSNLKNWQADDYLAGYCELGLEDYLIYRDFKEKYGFGHDETKALLSGTLSSDGSQVDHFKEGTFRVRDLKSAERNAEKILMLKEYYRDGYKRRAFVKAMLQLFQHPEYNHAEFLNKLSYQSVKLVDCTTVKQYITLIEEIYNYKRYRDNKVNFRF
jgi:hypothetical protein